MTGNGDAQQLEKLEAALTGMRPQPTPATASMVDDIIGLAEAQAEQAEAAAKYILEHAQFIHGACLGHAEKTRADAAHFASNLLAAEQRKMAELARIMGKLGAAGRGQAGPG